MIAAAFTLQDGEVLMAVSVAFFAGLAAMAVLYLTRSRKPEAIRVIQAKYALYATVSAQARQIAALKQQHTLDVETICDLQEQVAEFAQFQTLIPSDKGAPTPMHHAGESPASAQGAPRA